LDPIVTTPFLSSMFSLLPPFLFIPYRLSVDAAKQTPSSFLALERYTHETDRYYSMRQHGYPEYPPDITVNLIKSRVSGYFHYLT
ncbi:MAG: hypothetical protein JSU58_11075, partial [Dehalococcoidales bacterium]